MVKIIKRLFVALWLGTIVVFWVYVVFKITTQGWDEFMRPAREAMAEEMKPSRLHD